MKTKVYCPDIECESCVKVINRSLQNLEGVEKFTINKDHVEVIHKDELKPESITSTISEKGFRAAFEPFEKKTFKERLRDFTQNKQKYENEYAIIKYSILTFFILLALQSVAYFGYFSNQEGFLERYGWWFFYTNLSIVSIVAAMVHLKSYRAQVTNMVGMMIGMTFGMQTGMLIGTILGATNGMLVGGTAGMLMAVAVGFYNGKCCGIMGVLEGMMAGVMGGLMGAMTGSMLILDNIFFFMPLFTLINMAVMWGLSYMIYEEVVENNAKTRKNKIDFLEFASYSTIATSIILAIMIYGPKTGVAQIILGGA